MSLITETAQITAKEVAGTGFNWTFSPCIAMHQHVLLIADILNLELGFQGVVITGWNGGLRFGEPHTVINAGIDIA